MLIRDIDPTLLDEGVLDYVKTAVGAESPEDIARRMGPQSQMAQLLALQQKYQGTQWADQIAKRIDDHKFRINKGDGEVMGPRGVAPVLPPEEWAKKNAPQGAQPAPTSSNPGLDKLKNVDPSMWGTDPNARPIRESAELDTLKSLTSKILKS
jgi:hypothetical protein